MKYTIKEFAKEIRKLYPGDYDDLTDEKLVELWLKKYPNDREKIEFSSNSDNDVEENHSWIKTIFNSLFGVVVIWICLTFFSRYVSDIELMDNLNANIGVPYEKVKLQRKRQQNNNFQVNTNYTNQNIEAVIDPNLVDSNTINSEDPPVQDAAGTLNSEYESNNQNNSNSSTNDISAQDVENIISKGLDIISYLSKSNEWESHTFPFRCTKCGETCTASGVYKERTDQFVPYKDEFPTRWFHTHNWERLK